jgi:hypothetical protein
MSQENVDFVIEGLRLFEAGEIDVAGRWHERCRITAPEGWPEQGPFEGRDAVQSQLERIQEDFSAGNRVTDVGVVAAEGEWVVLRFTWVTRGSASEVETVQAMAAAFRVRDGLLSETHYRWTPEEALEAAGISE